MGLKYMELKSIISFLIFMWMMENDGFSANLEAKQILSSFPYFTLVCKFAEMKIYAK